jgi:succinate-acetate transporter protein
MDNQDKKPAPPRMNPYIFTILLAGFGLWCFWDGWITTDPEMLEHATFNRVLSIILIGWAVYDFFKLKKKQKAGGDSKEI